ncbi:MAG: hypothetical protein ACMUIG_02125 [Thermoplasmatota archaeon]
MMGFVIGALLAQPALDESIEDLKDARIETSDQFVELANTDFSIESAEYNSTTDVLNISIKNNGAGVIERDDINTLIDGWIVDSPFGEGLYVYPTQTATQTVNNVTDPGSVAVIGPYGISRITDNIVRT